MDANTVAALVAVLAALPGIYAIWQNRNKVRADASVLDASTAEKYQEIARKAAERMEAMQKRLDLMDAQLFDMQQQLKLSEARAARFEGWAKRLAGQVTSMGGIPVPLETDPR